MLDGKGVVLLGNIAYSFQGRKTATEISLVSTPTWPFGSFSTQTGPLHDKGTPEAFKSIYKRIFAYSYHL